MTHDAESNNTVFGVFGYDLGGNSGDVCYAVFSSQEAAEKWIRERDESVFEGRPAEKQLEIEAIRLDPTGGLYD